MYYANINDDSVVFGISQLSGQVAAKNMIPIETYDTTVMGKKWDGEKFVISDVPTPKRFILSRYEFRQLFTFEEQVAITTAAKSDITIEVFMKSMEIAEAIDLRYPETSQGLGYLVSQGLIKKEKMDEILAKI